MTAPTKIIPFVRLFQRKSDPGAFPRPRREQDRPAIAPGLAVSGFAIPPFVGK